MMRKCNGFVEKENKIFIKKEIVKTKACGRHVFYSFSARKLHEGAPIQALYAGTFMHFYWLKRSVSSEIQFSAAENQKLQQAR